MSGSTSSSPPAFAHATTASMSSALSDGSWANGIDSSDDGHGGMYPDPTTSPSPSATSAASAAVSSGHTSEPAPPSLWHDAHRSASTGITAASKEGPSSLTVAVSSSPGAGTAVGMSTRAGSTNVMSNVSVTSSPVDTNPISSIGPASNVDSCTSVRATRCTSPSVQVAVPVSSTGAVVSFTVRSPGITTSTCSPTTSSPGNPSIGPGWNVARGWVDSRNSWRIRLSRSSWSEWNCSTFTTIDHAWEAAGSSASTTRSPAMPLVVPVATEVAPARCSSTS